jgi:glycosyltransferase involved in cell wall biosynthesis
MLNQDKINVLYVSTVCSKKVFDYIYETSYIKPRISIQKFHKLFVGGIKDTGFFNITSLSILPISAKNNKRLLWNVNSEICDGVKYVYTRFINISILNKLMQYLYVLLCALLWVAKPGKKVIVCDVLTLQASAAILIGKIFHVEVVGIITDIPLISTKSLLRKKVNLIIKFSIKYIIYCINQCDSYVMLTEQMMDCVKRKDKDYVIIEGFSELNKTDGINNIGGIDENEMSILYAGGLYEGFGVKMLIEAFMCLRKDNIRLDLYGYGEMVDEIKNYMKIDNRIRFMGMVPNNIVVEAEKRSYLLVNPRPSDIEIAKYSFPSKIIEYMSSGRPVLTTKLPGIPKEYYDYLFFIDDESADGMKKSLEIIIDKDSSEINKIGAKAYDFMRNNKSAKQQSLKFYKMINR